MEEILKYQSYFINYATYIGFTIQIFVAEIVFASMYRRHNHFYRKQVLSLFLQMIAASAVSNILVQITVHSVWSHMLEQIIAFIALLLFSSLGLKCVYQEKDGTIILCVMSAYALQHFMSQIELICFDLLGARNAYVQLEASMLETESLWIGSLFYLLSHVLDIVILLITYWLFTRKSNEEESSKIPSNKVIFLSGCTIILLLVFSSARDYFQNESIPLVIITRLFSVMCCVFILIIRSGFLEQNQLENEVETIKQLNHKERAQYEQNRQNIELINIKCHDLKKRLEQYEDRIIGITPEEMDEMKSIISIYDTTVQTGNETLDTILTERSLICEKQKIVFSCIVDGASLKFLSTGDIFSLFANAVDNAMEAVMRLENEKNRIISLSVRKRMGCVAITVDNYYVKETLNFEGELPKTSKQNEHYHGYGMKSIQMIVKKYNGEMTITTDDMFHLSILLPIPEWGNHVEMQG